MTHIALTLLTALALLAWWPIRLNFYPVSIFIDVALLYALYRLIMARPKPNRRSRHE